jgi:hypothetical protein
MDYTQEIQFANIRVSKVLKLKELRDKAISAFRTRFADDADDIALGFALKLSISGSNLDRMVPMEIKGHSVSSETFKSCVKPERGQDVKETDLTVSRFCAALATDISKYLELHPMQVRTVVNGVKPKLSFPHNYYVEGLTIEERQECIVWLMEHDKIMEKVTGGKWRELSLKATAYFAAQTA